ncbi:MAG TPA: TrmH family RNA methyltransferase [Bacteroidia bacterium]|nr:TrmH family RNA methyltransferase [Bacteroidia bacterium]
MRKLKNEELERKSVEEFKQSDKTPIVIVLDNVRSLNNIGSVFRTADAFLIEAIYLCGITATPPHKDIHKTALGATDSVAWNYFTNTIDAIEKLRENKYKIYAIEQAEKSIFLNKFLPNKNEKIALIFGNEINGVAQNVIENCDNCIEIPQLGTKHSLNIAVSVGVVVWDVFSKMKN